MTGSHRGEREPWSYFCCQLLAIISPLARTHAGANINVVKAERTRTLHFVFYLLNRSFIVIQAGAWR